MSLKGNILIGLKKMVYAKNVLNIIKMPMRERGSN
jgi:hypothetical protein